MEIPVNYWAVLLAAVASMALGFLWYGPLFGKTWSHLMGWGEMTPERMAEMQKNARPAYAITFVGSLVMAYMLAHIIEFASSYPALAGAPLLQVGLTSAFFNWLGFVAPVTIGTVLWDGKPWKLWFINAGYYLVLLLVMGVILALWPQ